MDKPLNQNTAIPMLHTPHMGVRLRMLAELGVPLTLSLQSAKIPTRILDGSDGYLPFRNACDWVDREAHRQGIDNFGLRSAVEAGPAVLPESVRNVLMSSGTLFQALCKWADLVQQESTHSAIWLDDSGKDLQLHFTSTFRQDLPGQADWIWQALILHLAVVREFLGPAWNPPMMLVPYFGSGFSAAQNLLSDVRLVRDPTITGLTVPRRLLDTASPLTAQTHSGPDDSKRAPRSLESSVREMVQAYLPDGAPGIRATARACGVSVRTLQRRLEAEGLRYEQIVSAVRFAEAECLLADDDLPIAEVALKLGYSTSSHFTRAFRRIAGMSPRAYQKRLAQEKLGKP